MRRKMRDVWLTVPEDVTPHMDNTPIDWESFPARKVLDGQFLIRAAESTPKDLEGVAEVIRTGFPVIRDTEFDILFEASGFAMLLGADDAFNRGEHFLIVAEDVSTGKIAALTLLSMAKKQRNAELVLITVHEIYQGCGIGHALGRAFDKYLEACGVEMVYVWAAAEHSATQRILEDLNFVPRAVVPGYYRIWSEGGQYRRTVEVFEQKFYHSAHQMATHELDLLPNAQALIVPW